MKKRVVVKVGTGVLTRQSGEINFAMLVRLVQAIADVKNAGIEIVLVTSGAVGAGLSAFELDQRPTDEDLLQACAAVGQARLMQIYDSCFRNFNLGVAQLLVTHEDLTDDHRSEKIKATLHRISESGSLVPIINENDSVAVFELKFGDNDKLSASVAKLLSADLLVLLTSVNGLLKPDPQDENDIFDVVDDIETVLGVATDEIGQNSVGGMKSKLEAVAEALDAQIETVIASGANPEQLGDLIKGNGFGTRFVTDSKEVV